MAGPSRKDDENFVREYRPLVERIVSQTVRQLDIDGFREDLVAYGMSGLLEARSRFDASRGVQFNTFAYYRIRGAVFDGLRDFARLPRRAHAKLKAAEAADQITESDAEARAQVPGEPTPAQAAQALADTLNKLSASYVINALGQDEEAAPDSAEEGLLRRERRQSVRAVLDALPDRERALIDGHYFQGRQFDTVAAELGISKSWASRLHSKALHRLREALESSE
ncbi:MAG: sigma-70 family RNA polymerase sigma factor [Myxococcales bacterium]|nr:sigma-70 family RNA polymerase sigma factor [Myxococcales bacterium]